MNLSHLLLLPVFVILFKWTALLALGWGLQGALRQRHPRWRLLLWRSLLVGGLLLPVLTFLPVPGFQIPVGDRDLAPVELSALVTPATLHDLGPVPAASPAVSTPPVLSRPATSTAMPPAAPPVGKPVSWTRAWLILWALGFGLGAARLIRWQCELARLRRAAAPPAPELLQLAGQIQRRLGVRGEVNVQVSDTVLSPFLCGLAQPVIILPRALLRELGPGETSALLSHEIAHLRRHDLAWCVAWRWLQAVCWFHPLVWAVPAAHNLACEQEADRLAAGQLAGQESYARLLARLALRVLALPAVETRLTVNGSSQIARRLRHLAQPISGAWNWRHTASGFSLAALLFLLTAGCQFSNTTSADSQKFKEMLVVVQDETGQPIAGATVLPDGFRVKGPRWVDGNGWRKDVFGPPVAVVTDRTGKAWVRYPVMGIPEEKELTGGLVFSVSHPEYATVRRQEYKVDSPEPPIRLVRGIHVTVSGYYGSGHQAVTNLIPNLSEEMLRPEDWQKTATGELTFHKLSPGGHLLQLMGRLPSGEIVYSDSQPFTAQPGQEYHYALEMKPGIRLEGRLDDQVPRPITNGRVLISVRPKEFPAVLIPEDMATLCRQYGEFYFWHSYRPVAADGTFVFESVPPGEVDVIVHGDGFVSQSLGRLQYRSFDPQTHQTTLWPDAHVNLPQPFPLTAPLTTITVATEPSATLAVTAKTKSGQPVAGATIWLNPNVYRMHAGIFGQMRDASDAPYRTIPSLPELHYRATTDANGRAVIQNVPARGGSLEVDDARYQVPLLDAHSLPNRFVHVPLASGETNHFDLTLEPRGQDYIGRN
jgi:beta-lactamase regulating signal transducer with metallopeptidase domain